MAVCVIRRDGAVVWHWYDVPAEGWAVVGDRPHQFTPRCGLMPYDLCVCWEGRP